MGCTSSTSSSDENALSQEKLGQGSLETHKNETTNESTAQGNDTEQQRGDLKPNSTQNTATNPQNFTTLGAGGKEPEGLVPPETHLDEARLRVAHQIREIPFFNMHSFTQIQQIASAMDEVHFEAGQVIFQKGDLENAFYLLKDISDSQKLAAKDENGVESVFQLNFCGETCLRYNDVHRRYSLIAMAPVTLLQISPLEYRNLIIRQAKQQESQSMHFLRQVPILKELTEEQLQALGRSLRHSRFVDGEKIITQGSYGSTFYFVESGTVKCVQRTQKGPNEVLSEVNRYSAGSYFGEGALLQDAPRNADVIAVGEVSCLTLLRNDFNDLLGSVQQLLEHNFRARVLKGVELLKTLTDAERSELADLLVEQVYESGEQILQQGDIGDRFYIIKEGEVRFTRDPKLNDDSESAKGGLADSELLERSPRQSNDNSTENSPPASITAAAAATALVSSYVPHTGTPPLPLPSPGFPKASSSREAPTSALAPSNLSRSVPTNSDHEEIARLFTGQYFGEGSLLTNQPRRASAYAVGNVTLLSLEGSIFSSVFDQSLQGMLNRNFEKRKQADTPIDFSDLEEIRVLGAGSYGQVLLVNDKVTGKTYALKSMAKSRIVAMNQQSHVMNEKAILESTNHPFIVGLKQSYVSNDYVFMLLEAVLGGELFAYMRTAGRLRLQDATFYIAQVVLVFEYLHSHNIIYRDLKPENLLVAANGYLKFTDFGLSKVLQNDRKTYTLCGTPAYAAPEIYNLSGHGKASDWWCLGVLTHELLSGTTPFDGDAEQIFASMEEYSRAYPNIRLPRGLAGDVGDFVLRLLNPNPNRRLGCLPRGGGARDVKMHSLFRVCSWNKLINETAKAPFKPTIASGFDTNNFYNPVVRGHPVQLANVDPKTVEIEGEWQFPSPNVPLNHLKT